MSKRQRTTVVPDNESDWDDKAPDCDNDDASFSPKGRKPTKRSKTQARMPTKTRGKDASNTSSSIMQDEFRHSRSVHTIKEPGALRTALLTWYETVHDKRGMPWRKPYDPNLGDEERAQRAYEVWISEVMLQQTQVATVKPYYNRWMSRFPTVRDLAEGNIDEVNAIWKGLGYYSRASRLLQGAQQVVQTYGGRLPNKARDLEANIPGIGRYSAGAISSIAYGEQVPALDGNVHRVMSRVLALYSNPKAKITLDILWEGAKTIVEIDVNTTTTELSSELKQYPGDINQALIELGSTVCKVRDPACVSCPLKTWCSGYNTAHTFGKHTKVLSDIEDACRVCEPISIFDGVTTYPMKSERKRPREELDLVNVIEWRSTLNPENRKILMVKRPEGGLLAGLYEFPSYADIPHNKIHGTQEKIASSILSKLQIDHPIKPTIIPIGDVQHIFSHIRKTYRVQWVILESDAEPPQYFTGFEEVLTRKTKSPSKILTPDKADDAKWVPLKDVKDVNMGTGVSKIWSLTKKQWENDGSKQSEQHHAAKVHDRGFGPFSICHIFT